jgi:two-component system chemotaxis sensor kinase CheA
MSEQDPTAIFLVEANELLEQIEQGLLDLETRLGDRDLVDSVFRGLHTLKGSGAMFGFDALAAFTHHCETAFDRVRKGEVRATPELIRVVLSARDHMRALVEGGADAAHGEALLAELHRVVADADSESGPESGPESDGEGGRAPAGPTTWRVHFALPADALVNGVNPLALLSELGDLGDCVVEACSDAVPPLDALDPTHCHFSWTVVVTTAEPRSAIEDVFIFVMDDMTLTIEAIDAPAGTQAVAPVAAAKVEAAQHAAVAPAKPVVVAKAEGPANDTKKAEQSLRVPAERLDELMDRVGELVIAQSRLKQLAQASADTALRSVSEEVERLASELRDTMMVVRMVPISNLFGRFRRLIHDLAHETGKTIDLTFQGETTELDKTIIERLADPLIHLIRNSADHGLEGPEERLAAGKPVAGQLVLAARHAGAEVIITVTDDGRGINRDRVRARAEQVGLLAPGAQISDNELLLMIFQPGFSTAEKVTNLSGRGVGMDVVKRTIEGLRGTIDLASTPGQGSTISLRIPLTLAIIDGLLVRVGQGRYVIPLGAVEECVELSPEQDLRSTGRNLISLRDQFVPFLRLREIFETGAAVEAHQKVVVVSTGEERVGLVVDQIIGDHQTVIKSLSKLHADVGTFSGATILGDGGVALILDVGHLVDLGRRQEKRFAAAS